MRFTLASLLLGVAAAETGIDGWLRYAPLPRSLRGHASVPSDIITLNNTEGSPVFTAGQELHYGFEGIFGKKSKMAHGGKKPSSCVVVGTVDAYTEAYGDLQDAPELTEDGFWLSTKGNTVQILGQNERGALYGAFEYLSMLAQGNFTQVAYATNPENKIRNVNQWDNMDGSIERGYGGASIFFANGAIVEDLTRVKQYARLLASVRVNSIIVNNVNANATLLTPANLDGLARIADTMRPYGIKIGISLNFASPQTFGGLDTFDPLDESVIAFWTNITDQIYQRIPDMFGYLVKANSEGQPGPIEYNRTLAEGSHLFSRPLQPYGGILMFRAFVYDKLNETNWKADRANAQIEFFKPLDGDFENNTVIQIKYGPIDFQVREPASPLFANLFQSNTAIELQVAQEYLGQEDHLVYLPPLWQEILNFDFRNDGQPSEVRDIMSGQRFNRPLGGAVAVVNVGQNATWLGSHLSMSNLYAYGRVAWNTYDDPEDAVRAWTKLTFGLDRGVGDTIAKMSMESWPAYENYSGNLGIQTLTDILYTHYGPNPQSQDNNGWGQWTRADSDSIGMDRTVSNGTGFAGSYPEEVAAMYENLDTTPDNLLLWFHHVPYTHKLKSGETVIQHFYNTHYKGADTAQTFPTHWQSLKGKIDSERYEEQLYRLIFQAGHSLVWRDAINDFYHNVSSIADEENRVGNHPWRIEAEDMKLDGYQVYSVSPFETASKTKAIVTSSNSTTGTASATIKFPSGKYDLAINYYDMYGGTSQYTAYINDREVAKWAGDAQRRLGHQPSIYLDGHSAIRATFQGVKVKKGDVLKIVGVPDGVEPAPLDYVSFLPKGIVD